MMVRKLLIVELFYFKELEVETLETIAIKINDGSTNYDIEIFGVLLHCYLIFHEAN